MTISNEEYEVTASTSFNRCLLTGANGYLGQQIKRRLKADGWEVVELCRRPASGSEGKQFRLGAPIDPSVLAGCQALVHCAYDFDQIAWKDIRAVNVLGSEQLFQAACAAKVERIIFISTISAFPGAQSLYGKAKLEIERAAIALGGWVIRPGLVYGERPGGMVGRLVAQVRRAKLLPIPGSGEQQMYLVHQDDVAEAVANAITKPVQDNRIVTVAHEESICFNALLHELSRALGRKVTLVPVPWQLMWLGLRAAEICGLRLRLRSDSLVSLVNQDPAPVLNAFEILGVQCRPFDPAHTSLLNG